MDYWIHTVSDVITILYAILSYRFKTLRNYLMIVFYFFTCVHYVGNAHIERIDYSEFRIYAAELFIFYFCVCQMITSSNWVLETVLCNLFMLATLIGMTYHMYTPRTEIEKISFVKPERIPANILTTFISFVAFTVVNRFILEKRERILFLAKSITQQ